MGTLLLVRVRRGAELTDAGSTVYRYTQQIFSLAEEMETAVQDIRGLRSGRLTIGASTTPGEYILPWVIGRFQQRYPGIEVSLSISNTQSILERIVGRELDLGMVGAPVALKGLASFEYVSDEITIIAAPSHPLAGKVGLNVRHLDGQRFVMREQGSATRRAAEACLDECGVAVQVAMELGSNEAVKRAVAAGLGLGTVSRFGSTPDTTAGLIEVLAVEGWLCRRPLTVFYRQDKHLTSAQEAFLHFLRDERPLPPQA